MDGPRAVSSFYYYITTFRSFVRPRRLSIDRAREDLLDSWRTQTFRKDRDRII